MISRPEMIEVSACRSCKAAALATLHAFGDTPLADRLEDLDGSEVSFRAPLTLCHCTHCGLCQIRETVEPSVLFGADYPYYSSVSPGLLAHFHDSARAIMARYPLDDEDWIIEAASNDGYMLEKFKAAGHKVLGVDPADGPVAEARRKGIDTRHAFFTKALAEDLSNEGIKAKVFLANNVLAHVADVNDFVSGISTALSEEGILVVEVPYLLDLVDGCAFDTIYHQHLLYFSLTSLLPLLERHGLWVNDAERIPVHGGSIRLFVSRRPEQSPRLVELIHLEDQRHVRSTAFYDQFLVKIDDLVQQTRAEVARFLSAGKKLAGYGAAAKATTLLHALDLPDGTLQVIYDKSRWKHGRRMPGNQIVICSPERLALDKPDVVLVLAWNFAEEIIRENKAYLESGGRFLIPAPVFREVSVG